MPKYPFYELGSERFQRLVSALLQAVVSPGVVPLGAGADGGRDALYEGRSEYPSPADPWEGRWVFQAKFHADANGVKQNRATVLRELVEELDGIIDRYGDSISNYIFITNVVLSAVPDTGTLDQISNEIIPRYTDRIRNIHVWHGEHVEGLLDGEPDIANRFFPHLDIATQVQIALRALASQQAEEQLEQLHQVFATETARTLRGTTVRLPVLNVEIHRPEVEEILTHLASGTPVLLVGDAGSGKSGIAALVTQKVIERHQVPVVVSGRRLSGVTSIWALAAELGLPDSVGACLRRISEGQPVVLIVDQLDSAVTGGGSSVLAQLAALSREIPGVGVVAVSRHWDFGTDPSVKELLGRGFELVTVKPLARETVEGLLKQVGVDDPSLSHLELGSNLFDLSVLVGMVGGGQDIMDVTSKGDMWTAFRRELASEGDAVFDLALFLAHSSVANPERTFDLPRPYPPELRALLSREVIRATTLYRGQFRHDNMAVHLCAWDCVEREWTPEEVIHRLGGNGVDRVLELVIEMYVERKPEKAAAILGEFLT